jgi:hypothetical protein
MDVWELNPEGWDRFGWWPLRFWCGIILAEGLHDWGRWAVLILNCTLAFALQLRKSTASLSGQPGSWTSLVVSTWPPLYCLDWPTEYRSSLGSRWWLQLALRRHKCLPIWGTEGFPTSAYYEYLSLSWCSDVVDDEWNSQILVNLSITTVPGCVSRNAEALGKQNLQLPDVAAYSGPPDGTCIIHLGTDQLLVKQYTVSDGQAASSVKDTAKQALSLSCPFSYLFGVCRPGQLCVKDHTQDTVLFRPTVLALRETGLVSQS